MILVGMLLSVTILSANDWGYQANRDFMEGCIKGSKKVEPQYNSIDMCSCRLILWSGNFTYQEALWILNGKGEKQATQQLINRITDSCRVLNGYAEAKEIK